MASFVIMKESIEAFRPSVPFDHPQAKVEFSVFLTGLMVQKGVMVAIRNGIPWEPVQPYRVRKTLYGDIVIDQVDAF